MKLSSTNNNLKKAFTLVEVAIVIIIIGLLVGGILQGQELIKQAQFRNLMKDIESYKAATITFVGKYNCLPGDCRKGYTYFQGQNCGINTLITTINPTGCYGNGNSYLSITEAQLFWQHLSYAKILKGSFNMGYSDPLTIGLDVPQVNFGKATGVTAYMASGEANAANSCAFMSCRDDNPANVVGGFYETNVFMVGGTWGTTTNSTIGAIITPVDAYEFDVKFDDGLYRSGFISGHKGRRENNTPGMCANDGNQTGSEYNADDATKNALQCILAFKMGF